MSGKRRKPAERAILFAAAYGELTLEQANDLLKQAGFRACPESSWEMLKRSYVPAFANRPHYMGQYIFVPASIAGIEAG